MLRFKLLFIVCVLLQACTDLNYMIEQSRESDIISYADKFVGMDENKNNKELRKLLKINPAYMEWCAAFVNAILHSQNIIGSEFYVENPYMARSFLKWGEETDNPLPGDIVVFPRGEPWEGHVGFFVASYKENNIEYYIILGGNQNDMVSYKTFEASTAISVRRRTL